LNNSGVGGKGIKNRNQDLPSDEMGGIPASTSFFCLRDCWDLKRRGRGKKKEFVVVREKKGGGKGFVLNTAYTWRKEKLIPLKKNLESLEREEGRKGGESAEEEREREVRI